MQPLIYADQPIPRSQQANIHILAGKARERILQTCLFDKNVKILKYQQCPRMQLCTKIRLDFLKKMV